MVLLNGTKPVLFPKDSTNVKALTFLTPSVWLSSKPPYILCLPLLSLHVGPFTSSTSTTSYCMVSSIHRFTCNSLRDFLPTIHLKSVVYTKSSMVLSKPHTLGSRNCPSLFTIWVSYLPRVILLYSPVSLLLQHCLFSSTLMTYW